MFQSKRYRENIFIEKSVIQLIPEMFVGELFLSDFTKHSENFIFHDSNVDFHAKACSLKCLNGSREMLESVSYTRKRSFL